jgi:hypothetical protein
MVERLRDAGAGDSLGAPGAERPARGREQQPRHVLAALAGQGLEDGVVLAVHGQQRDAAGGGLAPHQRARHHQHLLVGERHVAAGADRRQRRTQTHRAHQGGHHQVGRVRGHGVEPLGAHADGERGHLGAQPLAQLVRARLAGQRHPLGAEAAHLLGQALHVAARGQRDDAQAFRERVDHPQHVRAHGSGAAQDGEAFHRSFTAG